MRSWTLAEAIAHGHGTERPFLCPVHGDSRPSASVNMIKKKWYCYTCGAHGGLTGEALLMEPDYRLMAQMLEERAEAHGRTYPESWLARFDAGPAHPYWVERFDEATARRFRLGYDHATDSATYPLRGTSGEVLGVVRRPFNDELGRKYVYPYGVDVSRLLGGYSPDARKAVVLVEGFLDAVALSMVGVHAFAIYGSRLSRHQVALVERVDPDYVYTAFDMDDAGYGAHKAAERAFQSRSVVRLSWPESWGKDIDEIGLDHRVEVVSRLLKSGLACVECGTCASPPSLRLLKSLSTSKRGRLRIRPMSA